MEILYFWVILTIIFILIEMFTATFYGLSLALSSTIVAFYVYFSWDTSHQIIHAALFVLGSGIFAYFLPRLLISKIPDKPQWLDEYVGMIRTVKKVGTEMKIVLDGVDYPIDTPDEIKVGDKVKIIGHQGISLTVQKKE
jgi:membrane protein implicated in regulation of membrane protease activity